MKKWITLAGSVCLSLMANAQGGKYDVSTKNPFGSPNPEAPEQVLDFQPMMGLNDCYSQRRNADGTWQDSTKMVWEFRYILNGSAVQDLTYHEGGFYATSIRQYNADSANWVVSYNSTGPVSNTPPVWIGGKTDDQIVLRVAQKAPNGLDGFSRLTFFDISDRSFNWKGEWVNIGETFSYPFWNIWCTKRE